MKVKYLIFAIAFALLNVGCSEKKEHPSDLNKLVAMLLNRCRGNLRQMAVCEVVGICHVMKRFVVLCAIVLTLK